MDRVLLRELQNDARQTNRDLAGKAGVSPSTSLERVRLLRERGVITGYHAALDLDTAGVPSRRSSPCASGLRPAPSSRGSGNGRRGCPR
ncbi:Lrp/AsnC family transcriptional regulator [Streptomyces sp. NBC_01334]